MRPNLSWGDWTSILNSSGGFFFLLAITVEMFRVISRENGRVLGEKPENGKFANPRTASPALETRAVALR